MHLPGVRRILTAAVIVALVFGGEAGRAQDKVIVDAATLEQSLGFEKDPAGAWVRSPVETIAWDSEVVHSGQRAARIERRPDSTEQFSTVHQNLKMDFKGRVLQLRAYARTEEVSGLAGLWMRLDGQTPGVAYADMRKKGISGTTDWTEYTITLPIHPEGRKLMFGFLLGGTGKAWVDDLQLLVDGKPVWLAPKEVRVPTVQETDQEFAAGSKIVLAELTPRQIGNLATLGRVWGFLKYHHPKVTSGELHWDYELFRIMPAILAAGNQEEANAAMGRWIDGHGDFKDGPLRAPLSEANLHLRPELGWLDDEELRGSGLGEKLRAFHQQRPAGDTQYYVSLTPNVANPQFDRELGYAGIVTADAGYQLLGLYRFWNIIRYWFPYRDVVEGDWDATLGEFIPRIGLAKDRDEYLREMMALIARVSDTHANLWSGLKARPPVGDGQLPVVLRFVEGRAVVTQLLGPAEAAVGGLRVGDVITVLDGEPVASLVKAWAPFYAASNEPTRLRDIARWLTRGSGEVVKLTVERDGQPLELAVARVPVKSLLAQVSFTHELPGETFRLLSPEVAYLKMSQMKQPEAKSYVERAAGTKGLVIDARSYPSDFLVFALGSLLVDQPTEFVRFTKADLAHPGAFHFGEPLRLEPKAPHYAGQVVILVDEVSQSSAEYTSMAYRASPRAKVIGSTTAGADGNVSRIPLPGGQHTMISGIGVFYPDKRPTQRVGIVPDIEVKPTLAGIRAGRDEVLEEALRQILGPEVAAEEIIRLARPTL